MSLTLKLASLAIRTLAKPVGNKIKSRAREHDKFRGFFVGFAQRLHRVDMRMRLGILHDTAVQERMHAREAASNEAKKKLSELGTVRTEAEQKSHDAETAKASETKETLKKDKSVVKIRPLSEARAIDLGANFASETFIFIVAAGLLVFERWWSKRKENKKDEHIVDRIEALEERAALVGRLEEEIRTLKARSTSQEKTIAGATSTHMTKSEPITTV